MKHTLTSYDFVNRFTEIRPDNFSRAALFALFDYYGELERESEDEIEFDPVAICCDWTEYESVTEAAEAYGWECPTLAADDEKNDTSEREALEYLNDNTTILELANGLLVLNF
jgi:hypothetical protein